tara:strand:- start:67418 stop:67831 length:414 start_codon:yes stop_codon:yes gene_type:complete
MARLCIVFGLLLCGLTIVALVNAPLKNAAYFVPMMLGIPILFCGVVGLNPHRLGTALRFAAAIATIGSTMGLMRVSVCFVRLGRDVHVNMLALKVVSAMTVLCLVFAILCLFSVLRMRRKRLSAGQVPKNHPSGEPT